MEMAVVVVVTILVPLVGPTVPVGVVPSYPQIPLLSSLVLTSLIETDELELCG